MAITIGAIILAVYLTICIVKSGEIPPSISATFYGTGKWWFTIVMYIEAICLCATLIAKSPDNWMWLGFLSGASLGFVGAAPHFRDEFEHTIHYAGAYMFVVCSQLWIFLMIHLYDLQVVSNAFIFVWGVALMSCLLFRSKATLITELASVTNIVIATLCM